MRCVNETRHYWVGHDTRLPDGRRLIGDPLSPLFHDETQGREALAEIKRRYPDARLIAIFDLEGTA